MTIKEKIFSNEELRAAIEWTAQAIRCAPEEGETRQILDDHLVRLTEIEARRAAVLIAPVDES